MKTSHILFSLTLLLSVKSALAQVTLPVPLNIEQAILKNTRTTNGSPGSQYWQNKGDYSIDVRFDPNTRLVSGTEQITYYNNSPDTIAQLLFKLYPNIYQKGSIRDMAVKPEDLIDGVSIANLMVDNVGHTVIPIPSGTNLQVPVTKLLPGNILKVSLDFSYTLNKGSHIRTGAIDSAAFFVAYFFPG